MASMTNGLDDKAKWVRAQTIEVAYKSGKGHLGGALSCVDILTTLFYSGIKKDDDHFILSKGHATLPLYIILADLGFFSKTLLDDFGRDGALLETHPHIGIPGIECTSGSLGNGIGIGAGMALCSAGRIFVLVGDAECGEGSIWEAAQFAAKEYLKNLVVIVDRNGWGATDHAYQGNLNIKWQAFGWNTFSVDGHNIDEISFALSRYSKSPLAIIANTVKGKGVKFMENKVEWHHKALSDSDYESAKEELNAN